VFQLLPVETDFPFEESMFGDDRPQMFRNDFEEEVVNQRPRLAAASVGRPLDVNKNLDQKNVMLKLLSIV
jgi:hypothetical protein